MLRVIKIHFYRNIKLLCVSILCFFFGYLYNLNSNIPSISNPHNLIHYEIVLVILTSPQNFNQRETIRKTWLNLRHNLSYDAFKATLEYMDVPQYNSKGFLIKDSKIIQEQRLLKYASKLENPSNQIKTTKYSVKNRFKLKYLFAIGTNDLPYNIASLIKTENLKFNDILLLPLLKDSYDSLTSKVIVSFEEISKLYSFKYLIKSDDDSFMKLNIIIEELEAYDQNLVEKYKHDTLM